MGRKKVKQSGDKDRSCNWCFVVFTDEKPESNPKFIMNIADQLINAYVSPYHENDIEEDGTLKPAHYHAMLMYQTQKSPEQVIEDIMIIAGNKLAGCNIFSEDYNIDDLKPNHYKYLPVQKIYVFYADEEEEKCIGSIIRITNKTGMARYFVHADHPNKYQYDADEVIEIGNVEYEKDFGRFYNKYDCINEMKTFVRNEHIYYMADLVDYASEQRSSDWFRVLCDSGAYIMDMYIKSYSYKRKRLKAIADGIVSSDEI